MARKTNATSVRQLAFARLNEKDMTSIGRKDAAEILMKEFDIQRPYAMTIYQQHRNEQKKSGAYTAVFVVRDIKDNKATTPFVSTSHVLNPADSDAVTPEEAVSVYCVNQNAKIIQAKDMKLPEMVKPEVKPVVEEVETAKPADDKPATVVAN